MDMRRAVAAIEKRGALLVYPIENSDDAPSLWSHFYPGEVMRWAWDESGDDRVVSLWHLRARLARSRKVVYTKWFRGRATFLSLQVFADMLAVLRETGRLGVGLTRDAEAVLTALEEDSPISSKRLRALVGLEGKLLESTYTRALRQLFERLLIVGFGEVDDGAFPSLAIGATRTIFEDVYAESETIAALDAMRRIEARLGSGSAMHRHFVRTIERLRGARPGPPSGLVRTP